MAANNGTNGTGGTEQQGADAMRLALAQSRKAERLESTLKVIAGQCEGAIDLNCKDPTFLLTLLKSVATLARAQIEAGKSGVYQGPKPY